MIANNESAGYLKVQVTSAGGAFPVEGAQVNVSDSDGGAVASLRTDRSGLTPTISLTAPPRSLSQRPENGGEIPYSTYTVQVVRDGYFSAEDYFVPVFDTVTSIQKVNLIPLSDLSPLTPSPRPVTVETPGYENLQGNKEENR